MFVTIEMNVKRLIATVMLLFAASPIEAQFSHAYDPNYVDFSAKMDTLRRVFVTDFNMGLLNDDSFDDLSLYDYNNPSTYQYGGPLLFDSLGLVAPFTLPILHGDFNGDGIQDLISHGFTLSNGPLFFKGKKDYPYLDSATGFFTDRYHRAYADAPGIIGAVDVNADGIPDVFGADGGSGVLALFAYYGGSHFKDSVITASDSMLVLPEVAWNSGTLGTYGKNAKPMMFIAGSATSPDTPHTVTYKIGVIRYLNDLAHDTVVYLSHTTEAVHIYHPGTDSMIAATGLYTMDITGDGIPDLLVTDGVYIYIFKGSDSLGYYPLTKDRAYYRIPHPALLEGLSSDWSYIDGWAVSMFNCGDMTGSGVPVLGVIGRSSTSGDYDAVFFYCGGKALDSLFDGLLQKNASFDDEYDALDTLHSIDNSGRSAVLVSVENLDLLLYRNGDKMPHRTNPLWLKVKSSEETPTIAMSAFPAIANRYVKIYTETPTSVSGNLTIFDLLGNAIASRRVEIDAGGNTEYFETSAWPGGTYIARLSAGSMDDQSSAKVSTTRFIVQH